MKNRFISRDRRNCGVINRATGSPCGRPLLMIQEVCDDCRRMLAQEYAYSTEGRAFLLEVLGAQAVLDEAGRQKREAEEARRQQRRDTAAGLRNSAGLVVYYARLGANHIKIGTTADLPRRMLELRVVNAGNLLAAEPGGYDLERQRHQQFCKWRYSRRKEDFGEGPELLEHIRKIRTEHGEPYQLAARLDKIQRDATDFQQADVVSPKPA
jgi:hypothetical protein